MLLSDKIQNALNKGSVESRDVKEWHEDAMRYELALNRPDPAKDAPGKWGKNSPETSRSAAFRPELRTGTQRERVLTLLMNRHLLGQGGMIDDEIQASLSMLSRSENPRRGELVDMGWVRDSGERRLTRARCEAIVWEYVPDARQSS